MHQIVHDFTFGRRKMALHNAVPLVGTNLLLQQYQEIVHTYYFNPLKTIWFCYNMHFP